MSKIINQAVITSCEKCHHFDCGVCSYEFNVKGIKNIHIIDKDCPLHDCEVITPFEQGKTPSMDFLYKTLNNWNNIDKIIIVKKKEAVK